MQRPSPEEYGSYYSGYVNQVPNRNVVELLSKQAATTALFLAKINEEASRYRYQPGKWSIREIVCHLADAERLFLARAVRIARGDQTPLPGFDENAYVPASGADDVPLSTLAADLALVRASTASFFEMITDEQSTRVGTASDNPFSVRAIAYIIVGHEMHHLRTIRDRYLQTADS